jgi:hypothetical protein
MGGDLPREKEEYKRELEHGLDGATLEPPRPQVGVDADLHIGNAHRAYFLDFQPIKTIKTYILHTS